MPDIACPIPQPLTHERAREVFKQVKKELPGLQESAYRREAARRMGVDYDTYLAAWKKPGAKVLPKPGPAKPPPGIPSVERKLVKNPTRLSEMPRTVRKYAGDDEVERGLNLLHDVRATNPNYHMQIDPKTLSLKGTRGYNENCVHVVQAFELRRRGYDVEASKWMKKQARERGWSAGKSATLEVRQKWRTVEGWVRHMTQTSSAEELKQVIGFMPVGARGFIQMDWKRGGGGHVMNWEITEEGVKWIEAQAGRMVDDIDAVLSRAYGERLAYIRLDDLVPIDSGPQSIMETIVKSQTTRREELKALKDVEDEKRRERSRLYYEEWEAKNRRYKMNKLNEGV